MTSLELILSIIGFTLATAFFAYFLVTQTQARITQSSYQPRHQKPRSGRLQRSRPTRTPTHDLLDW